MVATTKVVRRFNGFVGGVGSASDKVEVQCDHVWFICFLTSSVYGERVLDRCGSVYKYKLCFLLFFPPLQIGDAYERIKSLGGDASNALLGGATEADSNISAPFQLPKTTYFERQNLPTDILFAVFPIMDELASLLYGVYMRKKMATAAPIAK